MLGVAQIIMNDYMFDGDPESRTFFNIYYRHYMDTQE